MEKEQQFMEVVTAPGIGDAATDVRIEWHQIGGGWKPVILHWHDYCEFEFILKGSGTHTLNNVSLPIRRGSAYLCMMNDFHKIRNRPDETMLVITLKFSESMIQEPLLKRLYARSDHRYCDFTEEESIIQMVSLLQSLQTIQSEQQSDAEIKKILLECVLNQIISLFLIHCAEESNGNANREQSKMQKAISYIHRNFTKDLSQAEVAEQAGLSVNYFSALFKSQLHTNYSTYLLKMRLNYARNLIVSNHITKVQTIASKVGFSSVPYFIKTFKKRFNVTPKEMIEQIQKKDSPGNES